VRRFFALALAASLLPCTAVAGDGSVQAVLDLETGALWASRNDAAVPGKTGSRFSMANEDFSSRATPFVRLQAGLRLGRHRLAATFAPIRLRGNGSSGAAILFRGQTFTADGDASFYYQFDTYRLTYRYALVDRPGFDLQLGVTALVRDAKIRLTQGSASATETNVGFVPLASFRASWRFAGPFRLTVDGDALAAKQGRAEDVLVGLEFETGQLTFRAGYRLLEGGADNDKVYSFAWLNHVVVGARYEP
jgi:hypothetical protein